MMKLTKKLLIFLLLCTITLNINNCYCQALHSPSTTHSAETCGNLQIVPGDPRSQSPWTVSIFTRSSDTLKFFTTAVIIGPTSVLAVARGPFGGQFRSQKSDNRLPPANIFVVFAGLNSTDHTQTDEFSQISQVNYLEPHLDQEETNEHYHYIIYHLKTVLDFKTPFVKAICLPHFYPVKSYTPFGWDFQFSGFMNSGGQKMIDSPSSTPSGHITSSSTSSQQPHELKVAKILTSTEEECNKLFKFHYKHELDDSQVFCGQNRLISQLSSAVVSGASFGRDVMSNGSSTAEKTVVEGDESTVPFTVTESGSANVSTAATTMITQITTDLCFLHGSALTYFFNKRWRLVGIVTLIPGRRRSYSKRCSDKTIYFFGKLSFEHVDWMTNSLQCSPNRYHCGGGGCIGLSAVCNGVPQCQNERDEEELLCEALDPCPPPSSVNETTTKMHSCGLQDKCIPKGQMCDGVIQCEDGSDEADTFCLPSSSSLSKTEGGRRRNIFCPPLKLLNGVVAKCLDVENNEEFNCDERPGPNTTAFLTCADYHVSNYQYSSLDMQCNSQGNWTNKRPFSCSAECGIHRVGGPNEQNSTKVDGYEFVSSFHWNALFGHVNGSHLIPTCSAVLVHDLFLVTAAECLTSLNKNRIIHLNIEPISLDAVKNFEAGRLYSAVHRYWIAKTNATSYEFAVLKLVPPNIDLVSGDDSKGPPACFASTSISVAKMMSANMSGQVLSFRKRKNEDGSVEEVFQVLDFLIVPKRNCQSAFPNFTIPAYAFCTMSLSGASLNHFEVGTGFYLRQKSSISGNFQYTLKGIAIGPVMKPKRLVQSLDDDSDGKIYQLFTNMESFHDWLLDVMEKYY